MITGSLVEANCSFITSYLSYSLFFTPIAPDNSVSFSPLP
jgi:hypothetical protein